MHNIYISIVALLFALPVVAQSRPAATNKAVADSSKAIVFTVKFGPYSNTLPLFATDFGRVANANLTVTDQKGQVWTIVAWRLGWRRKETSDDYKTGKRKVITTFNATPVYNSAKIPASWQKEISEFLQKGEELLFEEIIAEHPVTKKKMQVPVLTLKVNG